MIFYVANDSVCAKAVFPPLPADEAFFSLKFSSQTSTWVAFTSLTAMCTLFRLYEGWPEIKKQGRLVPLQLYISVSKSQVGKETRMRIHSSAHNWDIHLFQKKWREKMNGFWSNVNGWLSWNKSDKQCIQTFGSSGCLSFSSVISLAAVQGRQ